MQIHVRLNSNSALTWGPGGPAIKPGRLLSDRTSLFPLNGPAAGVVIPSKCSIYQIRNYTSIKSTMCVT